MIGTRLTPRWHRRGLLLVCILACACGGGVRSQIESEIQKGVRAVQKKDLDVVLDQIPDETLGPDTTAIREARQKIRASLSAQWAAIVETRGIRVTLDSVRAGSDSALVSTTLHWDRIVRAGDGVRQDTIVTDVAHREIWRLTPKGWRSFKMISAKGTETVNGKEKRIG